MISPVTQVALVAVNKASVKGVQTPCRLQMGRVSKSVPVTTTSKKLTVIIRTGVDRMGCRFFPESNKMNTPL